MTFTLRYHHKLVFSILIVLGIVALLLAIAQDQETLKIESAHSADDPLFPAYVAALLNAQATGGNRYDVLTNGDQIFPSMLAAINGARRRISFETYIYEKSVVGEQFTAALEAAGKRGVQVNLVVDGVGSNSIPKEWRERLRAAGAQIGEFGQPKWYSLELNDEMNVAVSDPGLAGRLLQDFEQDLRRAKKLEPSEWRRRSPLEKARERFWSYFGEIF